MSPPSLRTLRIDYRAFFDGHIRRKQRMTGGVGLNSLLKLLQSLMYDCGYCFQQSVEAGGGFSTRRSRILTGRCQFLLVAVIDGWLGGNDQQGRY